MEFKKRVLGQLERAYAAAIMKVNGEDTYFIASEGKNACVAFNEKWESRTVWTEPGGTMNIVPVPGRENEFIATQGFWPTFQAQESRIVHGVYQSDGTWMVKEIMAIPYLHRFDVIAVENRLVFIGATLCESKESKEDWSKPGSVYVGEIGADFGPFTLTPIWQGITKNHGFCRGEWQGRKAFLVSGAEGVFAMYVPTTAHGQWEVEQLLAHEVSDMAVCDIDGDGKPELATIEPFHGSKGVIYKEVAGKLTPIHEHEYEFGHVVWGGTLAGKPSFVIGGRKGNRELNVFQVAENGDIQHVTIDNTGGPSNIAVINKEGYDLILAANREIGEMAVYEIRK